MSLKWGHERGSNGGGEYTTEAVLLGKGWMDVRMERKEEGKDTDGWMDD